MAQRSAMSNMTLVLLLMVAAISAPFVVAEMKFFERPDLDEANGWSWAPDDASLSGGVNCAEQEYASYDNSMSSYSMSSGMVKLYSGHSFVNLIAAPTAMPGYGLSKVNLVTNNDKVSSWSWVHMPPMAAGRRLLRSARTSGAAREAADALAGALPSGPSSASGRRRLLQSQQNRSWQVQQNLTESNSSVAVVSWSPSGRLLISASESLMRVWESSGGAADEWRRHQVLSGLAANVSSLSWSPNGTSFATIHDGAAVFVWSIGTDGLVNGTAEELPVAQQLGSVTGFTSVSWSPDGRRLGIGSDSGQVVIWHLQDQRSEILPDHPYSPVDQLAWSPTGSALACISRDASDDLWLWQFNSTGGNSTALQLLSSSNDFTAIAWSPDGSQLAVAEHDPFLYGLDVVYSWPVTPGGSIPYEAGFQAIGYGDSKVSALSWSPDGSSLAGGYASGSLEVWPMNATNGTSLGSSQQLMANGTSGHPVTSLSWSPDGAGLASAHDNGAVLVWALTAGNGTSTYSPPAASQPSQVTFYDGPSVSLGDFDSRGESVTVVADEGGAFDLDGGLAGKVSSVLVCGANVTAYNGGQAMFSIFAEEGYCLDATLDADTEDLMESFDYVPVAELTRSAFHETFDSEALFDLQHSSVAFLAPTYEPCLTPWPGASYPEPTGQATNITGMITDDSFVTVPFADGFSFRFFGREFHEVHIGSNGYLTFGAGTSVYGPDYHFDDEIPRVSALMADLNPASSNSEGRVYHQQLADRFVVTFQEVSDYGRSGTVNFQVALLADGSVRVTYLDVTADSLYAIVGLAGPPLVTAPVAADLSSAASCAACGSGLPACLPPPAGPEPEPASLACSLGMADVGWTDASVKVVCLNGGGDKSTLICDGDLALKHREDSVTFECQGSAVYLGDYVHKRL